MVERESTWQIFYIIHYWQLIKSLRHWHKILEIQITTLSGLVKLGLKYDLAAREFYVT